MGATVSIRPGSVKICSLREEEHAGYVVDAGADLFGLIFAPARRRVTVDQARRIVEAVRTLSGNQAILAVGVFVDAGASEINQITEKVGLDLVQLHGSEPPALLAELAVPAVKAVRPRPGEHVDSVRAMLEGYLGEQVPPAAFLVDGFDPSHAGGEGVRADWTLAAQLTRDFPIVLAGGLTPENVCVAIETVGPLAVDVSSGVETGGAKDPERIATFVRRSREAYARQRSAIGLAE